MKSSLTPFIVVAAGCGIYMSVLAAGRIDGGTTTHRDLTLIGDPASPEKRFAAELEDLRERLSVINDRILAEHNDERREDLRQKREAILTREKTVRRSLEEARLWLARLNLRTLEAAQRALVARLVLIDGQIASEDDDARLKELRRERELLITREKQVSQAIEKAGAGILPLRSNAETSVATP
jgi:hypothetical protein